MISYEYDCNNCLKDDVCKYKHQYISTVNQIRDHHIIVPSDDPELESSMIRVSDMDCIEQPIRIHCKFRFEKPVIRMDATSTTSNVYVSEETIKGLELRYAKPLFGGLIDDRE